MKRAKLTSSLLIPKGKAVPSLSNRETQNYDEAKKTMFASLTKGSERDIELEYEVPQEVVEVNELMEMKKTIEALEAVIPEISLPDSNDVEECQDEGIDEPPPKKDMQKSRISTSLRLCEDRHLQLRLLAARENKTLQTFLHDLVVDHIDQCLESAECICNPEKEE